MFKKTSKRKMILDIFFALLFISVGLWHFFTAPMSRGEILFLGITFGIAWTLLWAIHKIRKEGLDA